MSLLDVFVKSIFLLIIIIFFGLKNLLEEVNPPEGKAQTQSLLILKKKKGFFTVPRITENRNSGTSRSRK